MRKTPRGLSAGWQLTNINIPTPKKLERLAGMLEYEIHRLLNLKVQISRIVLNKVSPIRRNFKQGGLFNNCQFSLLQVALAIYHHVKFIEI